MSEVTAPPPARPLRELLPHLIWEAVLLVAAAGVVLSLYNRAEPLFTSGGYWLSFASLGFATAGMSLSLRTGTPNLAIGPLALLASYIYADSGSMAAGIATAAGIGLVLAALVALTTMPGWAVTLMGGLIAQAIVLGASDAQTTVLKDRPQTYWTWGVAFIVISIAGGAVFAIPAVRRFLSANRPAGGEAGAFTGPKLVGALVGVFGSSVAAGFAGVILTIALQAATPVDNGFTLAALAAALLAGVSPFGRRAGILGVVLAVAILDGMRRWVTLWNGAFWVTLLVEAGFGLLGLLVVWLFELIGRRASPLVTTPATPLHATPHATPPSPSQFPPPGALPPGYPPPAAPPLGTPPPYQPAPPAAAYPAQPTYPAQPAYPGQATYPGQPPTSAPPASAPPAQPGYAPPSSAPPAQPAYGPPTSAPPSTAPPAAAAPAPPASAPPASSPPASGPPAPIPPLPGTPPPQSSGPNWPPAQ
ncbi:hypothetical protein [Dactylosporangium sp. NPDC051541]|uniref:hypothetical protein n=1 Tax=Dactylosporangium sp. NPDC051541 TaxID=3363977 RepID=UPI00379C9CA0